MSEDKINIPVVPLTELVAAPHCQIVVTFGSITYRASNLLSQDQKQHPLHLAVLLVISATLNVIDIKEESIVHMNITLIVSSIVYGSFGFQTNGWSNPDVFQPIPIRNQRGIIPQNFSSLGFAVSEELGKNKHSDSLTFYCFYRVMI